MRARRVRRAASRALPPTLRRALRERGLAAWPPRGTVRFGSLRRASPISASFGFDRGTPIDRFYIESFLRGHAGDVRGRVLEVGDDRYARMFGGDAVERVDVLNVHPGGEPNEIVDDLTQPRRLEAEMYDCVICAQTLHLIYELERAVESLRGVMRPNGVLLATVPGISRDCSDAVEGWIDHWRLTPSSASRLFTTVFGAGNVRVRGYGNVLAAIAFLHGISTEELRREELELRDEAYDVVVAVRAQRGPRD